jgi:uncharacterized protein (DUF433 family)
LRWEACIAGTRIAVWLLVEARQLGISEAQLLQDYPRITAAALVNAWAYADAHPEEIAAAIRVNAEEFLKGKLIQVVRPSPQSLLPTNTTIVCDRHPIRHRKSIAQFLPLSQPFEKI